VQTQAVERSGDGLEGPAEPVNNHVIMAIARCEGSAASRLSSVCSCT
jgi:hypothetical protein